MVKKELSLKQHRLNGKVIVMPQHTAVKGLPVNQVVRDVFVGPRLFANHLGSNLVSQAVNRTQLRVV